MKEAPTPYGAQGVIPVDLIGASLMFKIDDVCEG